LPSLGGSLLVSAPIAAAQPDPATPLGDAPAAAVAADRTIRAEALDGLIVNTIYLDGDGSLRIIAEEDGATTQGRWFARNDMACLEWQPRGRECWPYRNVATRGEPTVIASDRGQRVRVTLLSWRAACARRRFAAITVVTVSGRETIPRPWMAGGRD
jgi:hypothetical protein